MQAKLGEIAEEVGPPLAELMERTEAARSRVGAFAIERVTPPDALALVARRLAVGQSVMKTREIADELRRNDFGFDSNRGHETATRAWLKRQPGFHELSYGNWTLGYHATQV